MPAQRTTAVSDARRSAYPGIAGVPPWAAVAIAIAGTLLGVAIEAGSGHRELGASFAACYVLGCVGAVLAVRQSGIFAAVIQPPLLLFVAVPLAYFLFRGEELSGLKGLLISCGYPLIERFPLMLFTALAVLVIGVARRYIPSQPFAEGEPTGDPGDDGAGTGLFGGLVGAGQAVANVIFSIVILSFLIPFDAIAVPLYNVMRGFGLQNTYLGLILPGIGNGLTVFLLRQFFLGLPRDLREAGMVDGMGYFQIFWRIYLPLSVPALISAGLIMFIFQWQAYLWPLLIAPRTDLKVAAVAIAQFSSAYDVSFGVIFAGAMFVSLIPMVILVIFQQYFTSSVAATGGKE